MIGGKKANGGKGGWWDDLFRTMNTNDFCDYETIHRFDPPDEHMGGGGDAGPMFAEENIVGDSSWVKLIIHVCVRVVCKEIYFLLVLVFPNLTHI